MPACGRQLTYVATLGTDTYVAEAAHIRGEKLGSARYDSSMTDAQRDAIENLMYLCTDDHTVIDKVEADWPASKLYLIKAEHERKVIEAMLDAFADIAFPQLATAVAWVQEQPFSGGFVSFDLTAPDKKIKKNTLGRSSRLVISAGMVSIQTVTSYVEAETQIDIDFPDKLRSAFLAEYYRLKHLGHKGDELFELMCAFSTRGLKKQADRTAGLAVLVYLFEICDVFER